MYTIIQLYNYNKINECTLLLLIVRDKTSGEDGCGVVIIIIIEIIHIQQNTRMGINAHKPKCITMITKTYM